MTETAVKERPIIFSAPMVRSILSGAKTQTRRIANVETFKPSINYPNAVERITPIGYSVPRTPAEHVSYCPHGKIGDRLWVRESFRSKTKDVVAYKADGACGAWIDGGSGSLAWRPHGWLVGYTAPHATSSWHGEKEYSDKWTPSIHMPRKYSRITLEIVDVRVERLQDIAEEDARAEGVEPWYVADITPAGDLVEGESRAYRAGFHDLWNGINGEKYPWESNPWVWAISFKKIEKET